VRIDIDTKTLDGWASGAGGSGEPGPAGPIGSQGPEGPQGPQGIPGTNGTQGPQGPQGIQGLQGIKGDTGNPGAPGADGLDGEVGAQGPQGNQGIPGDQGPQGIQGPQGPQGDTGPQGIQGDPGAQGNQGIQGPAGVGADPWTFVQVNGGLDFTSSNTAAVDVPGLAFTPVANTIYEFEAMVMLRTATATVNPRLGLAWPTGLTDGVVFVQEAQVAIGAAFFATGNPNGAALIAVGGLPNNTQSWPGLIRGFVVAGAAPSGAVRVQLASETGGTNVTIRAKSWLRYRTIPI
jgi:hypothetical protein